MEKKKLNFSKTILTIGFLNAVQIGAAIGVIAYDYFYRSTLGSGQKTYGIFLLIVIISTVLLNSFLTIRDVKSVGRFNDEYYMIKTTLDQVENLNKTLRAQRHDFMNHLQVVYGLIEMNEYGDVKDYIEKVFNDIQKVSNILKTANPAVNALLQAKILYGEKRGIEMNVNITSRLNNLKVPSWEFCRVLGNIIDNSIYALQESNKEKSMEIHLYEDLKNYAFKIINNGPRIPERIIGRIFEPGFTTKGEKGEGMGLAISKDVLTQYGGDISVVSNEQETVFEGWVPRQ